MIKKWHCKVLTTDDKEEWRSLVETMPKRDVFFCSEYIIPFERLWGEAARLFFFGNEANYIIYPFFLRPINNLPFYRSSPLNGTTEYFDIVSPYGYSGPLAYVKEKGCQHSLWEEFLTAFHQYCQEMNIVCEFTRLNPFVSNTQHLQALTDGVQFSNQITYLDLTRSEDELWRGFNRGNRSNINKAKRCGVVVEKDNNGIYLQKFYELYLETMRRNQAEDWYDFSLDFFVDSFTSLGNKISLFCASYDKQIVAAASFLHDGEVVHYFLGASDSNYLTLRPNNLLMYRAICWAKRQGFQLFNLGGGYKDSLARFKAGFSKLSTTFYTYRFIHNRSTYDELCRRHATFLRLNANHHQDENLEYFPLYRINN